MGLSQEQQYEFDLFRKEVEQKMPQDFLQFGINYFNEKLQEQRIFVRSQESLALSKGITLFPNAKKESSGHSAVAEDKLRGGSHAEDEDVFFKSPFVGHDPHSTHIFEESKAPGESSDPKMSATFDDGLFNRNFSVARVTEGTVQSSLDPKASEETKDSGLSLSRGFSGSNKPLPRNFNAQRRTSVSGETLKPDNFNDWTPQIYAEKTSEQLKGLEDAVGKNFLFNKLDSDSKSLVINSLEERFVSKGEEIIRQGDEGDYFYIVQKGTVEFYLDKKKVNTSGAGSCFGELALMYNSPRAATVVAATDCILWALDRLTFRKILLGGSFKKRLLYDDFLKSMPLLKSLSTYDRAKLADALDTEYYEPGEVIIREGDIGENFYLIEYGQAEVSKAAQGVLAKLKKGDYFGEVALLNDLPRQATVKAITRTKVVTLGKSGFQRLLGPAVEVLKSNDPTRSENKK